MPRLSRLRWQLTASHLIAIAVTLVAMIAAVLTIGLAWLGSQNDPARAPAQAARTIARMVGGMVGSDAGDARLSVVLGALVDGSLRLDTFGGPDGGARRPDAFNFTLRDVAYVVILAPDGRLLASSDASGAAFAPAERDEWRALAVAVVPLHGDPGDVVRVRGLGQQPAAFGAFPIVDGANRVGATVVVASPVSPSAGRGLEIWQALAIFGAASVAVLVGASLFALVSSTLVGYFLSRRLVRRLEQLGGAAEALATGNLQVRVDEGANDEVGSLARRFNRMASDLERTLGALQAERDRVEGLLAARRQLVAGVSHELRTPVTTVRGYLESALAREANLGDDLRSDLETIEREIIRLQRLIDDLFTLSRAEVGRLELRLQPTDIGAVVRRLVATLAPLAWTQRKVQVLAESANGTPPAQADTQRVEQITSNLLGNAIRHTPPGGLVAVSVAADDGWVQIEVRDTGDGIQPADLERVFERFYRASGEEGQGGVGLGLALVKELAEAMHGSVAAASTPGEGSTFTVRLPRA